MMLRTALVALLFACSIADASAAPPCRAIDGDTIRCGAERIRLKGIYAAELAEPGGRKAHARLQRKLEAGEVRIERHGRDRFGRTLGHLYVDGMRVRQEHVGPVSGRGAR